MSEETGGKLLSVDSRPLRDIGNAFGFSIDKQALRDLGALDENGNLAADVDGRQVVTDDGTVRFELDLSQLENADAASD